MRKRPVYRQRLGLDDLNDEELRRRYRFDREGILYIRPTDLMRDDRADARYPTVAGMHSEATGLIIGTRVTF